METEYEMHIEEIMGVMTCPKDFECCKSGFVNPCNATGTGMGGFIKCLEAEPEKCWFSVISGQSYLCQCPLRIYVANNPSCAY